LQEFSFRYDSSGCPFTLHDLDFKTVLIPAVTSCGTKYFRPMRVGMPKIPEDSQQTVFYVYSNKEDARDGNNVGGTGFYAGIRSEKHPNIVYIYGITNWHVVFGESGASVIRVNRKGKKPDILDYDLVDWDFIPNGGDVAISPILSIGDKHLMRYVQVESFATENIVKKLKINVGDNMFMMGRFVDHDGGKINLPSARFGHISVMPTYVPREDHNNLNVKSYILDMHSRTGYSGSPVYVFRVPCADLDAINSGKNPWRFPPFLYLLGIHWGQFPEEWKGKKGTDKIIFHGVSGMSLVVPAERILDLINTPKLKAQRDIHDSEREEHYQKHGYPPILD